MATNITEQEITQIKGEIDSFQQKSLQYASSSPTLSAHYHRLFLASQRSLKSFDRLARVAKNKAYQEQRKNAKQGANGTAAPRRESTRA
jgi:hypothetical protein